MGKRYIHDGVGTMQCPLCGVLIHGRSKGSGKITEANPMYECPQCVDVALQNPDLVSWVIAVLKTHIVVDHALRSSRKRTNAH
jgi:predicted RNA-binding Zn-ribbon protein involved in translation (DUF1610 family)